MKTNLPFVIRDCNGRIVGNRNGYRTHEAASKQAHMKTSKAYREIWEAFYSDNKENETLIYTIKEEINRVHP